MKLSLSRDSDGTFQSSSQTATCSPSCLYTRWRLHTVFFISSRKAVNTGVDTRGAGRRHLLRSDRPVGEMSLPPMFLLTGLRTPQAS